MSAETFIVSKGRINELANRVENSDPGTSGFLLAYYQGVEAFSVLETRATKSAVDANNTECTFTNYVVQTLANVIYSTAGVEGFCTADDQVLSNAGGVVNNTIVRAIVYYATDTALPANAIPLAHYQFDITTDGSDLTFDIPASGLYRSG